MQSKPGVIIIEGHVQGLSNTRSYGEAGIPVYVVDKNNCIARYSIYCKKFFRCPDFQSDDFVDFLVELGEKDNLKNWLLLPSNDHAVYTISRQKERLEKIFKVITPAEHVINRVYNKQELLKAADISRVSYPVSWFPENLDEEISHKMSFPVLVKGKFGLNFFKTTGKKAFYANNTVALRNLFHILSQKLPVNDLFVQEVIPHNGSNKTTSFCAFCEEGEVKTYWIGRKLREHPIKFGTATYAESVYIPELEEPASNLLKELNFTGPCEVEFLQDPRDNQYKLIEINARTWLWVSLARECGVDFAKIIYDYLHNSIIISEIKYKNGLKWINWCTDLPISIHLMLLGKLTIKDYLNSMLGEKIRATFKNNDIKPSLAYLLLLFKFFKNR